MRVIVATVLLAGTAGCNTLGRLPADREAKYLHEIPRDGVTTREEIVAAYGAPHGEYDGGRVLTWRLKGTGTGRKLAVETEEDVGRQRSEGVWGRHPYCLVAVVQEGRVVRHSLVRIR